MTISMALEANFYQYLRSHVRTVMGHNYGYTSTYRAHLHRTLANWVTVSGTICRIIW